MREGRWMGMDRKRSATVLQADLKAVRGEYNMTSEKADGRSFGEVRKLLKAFRAKVNFQSLVRLVRAKSAYKTLSGMIPKLPMTSFIEQTPRISTEQRQSSDNCIKSNLNPP